MRRNVLVLAGSACLLLSAAGASAASYHVLEGTLTDAATGQTRPLTGSFDTSVAFGGDTRPMVLGVDDFALQAGEQSFTPRPPTPYLGLAAVSLADQIHVDGDAVAFVLLQAGGPVEEADGDVTIRTVEFRADRSDGGQALGDLPEGPEPRRLDLQGQLFQVDRTYRIFSSTCTLPLPGYPPPGGGGVVIQLPGRVIDFGEFDITGDEVVSFVPPSAGGSPVRVTVGDATQIGGDLQVGGGSVLILAPEPVALSPLDVLPSGSGNTGTTPLATAAGTLATARGTSPDVPTLDELGITAPAGAEVSFDASGALVVTSEGDLLVTGGSLALPGLTSVTLTTPGSVSVEGEWRLPADVSLTIDAGGSVDGGSLIGLPGDLYPPPPVQPIVSPCVFAVRPVSSEEVPVGSFSLVASAAQPADVELWPGRRHHHVRPGSRGLVAMVLHGSSQLDVRDVVPDSLRLGRGEAAPVGRVAVVRARGHRGRRGDLLALFRVRDAAIAFGDAFVCLSGATADGSVFEGCDTIDTAPRWHHSRH